MMRTCDTGWLARWRADDALAKLEQSVKLGYADADHAERDDDLRTLRDLARFEAILASMRQAAS